MGEEAHTIGRTTFEFHGFATARVSQLLGKLRAIDGSETPLGWTIVENAHVSPLTGLSDGRFRGGVFGSEGQPIEQAAVRRSDLGVVVGSRPSAASAAPECIGDALFGGVLFANYGHVLLESLARLWCARHFPDRPILFLALDGNPSTNLLLDLAQLLGIERGRVRFVRAPVICSSLVVPEPGIELGLRTRKHYVDWIRHAVKARLGAEPARDPAGAYFSRSKLGPKLRKPFGEDVLEAMMRDAGHRVLWPETMPFDEQLRAVNRHAKFAGFIGSQFHTLLFRFVDSAIDVAYLCNEFPNVNFLQLDMLFEGRRVYANAARFDPLFDFGNRSPFRADHGRAIEALKGVGLLDSKSTETTTASDVEVEPYAKQWFFSFFFFIVFRPVVLDSNEHGAHAARAAFATALNKLEQRLSQIRNRALAEALVASFIDAARAYKLLDQEIGQFGLAEVRRIAAQIAR